MKKASRFLAVLTAIALLFSVSALASSEASGESSGEASGSASGEASGPVTQTLADLTASDYATLDAVNTRSQDKGFIYVGVDIVDGEVTDQSNWDMDPLGISLNNAVVGAGFSAVHVSGEASEAHVVGGMLSLSNGADDAQGEHASDFTGMGAAFVAADNARLTVTGATVFTDGFVRAGVIVDAGATAWIENSYFVTYGADPLTEAYEGYANSATTSKMLSPPWVLGIQGGIRTVNVLDTNATFVLVDSSMSSGGWGVVSTDGCTTPKLVIIDSALRILSEPEGGMDSGYALYGYEPDAYGSGYGAYLIGTCDEQYYGSTVSGATFGAIAREGYATYQSSNGEIEVISAKGESLGTVEGKGNVSEIDTVIGVMTHSSESVGLTYTDGTIINTAAETVLYRSSGHADFVFDNAVVNPGNGIIGQMIDDDDSTVGMGDFSTMGFNTELVEAAGMPSANGSETGATANNEEASFVFRNGEYAGDLYNGTGYYGQAGDVMNVTVGENASLTGAIALTETFHGIAYSPEAKAFADAAEGVEYVFIDADYNVTDNEADAAFIQFTRFTIDQYYMLCRMLNHIYSNGYSGINVTVEKDGVWNVAGESLINYLKVEGEVYGELTENADGTLTLLPGTQAIPAGEYGTAVEANVAAATGMGNAGGSAEPAGINPGGNGGGAPGGATGGAPGGGEPSGEPSDEPSAEPAAAGGADTSEAAYQAYLKEYVDACPAVSDEAYLEFAALIDAGDYTSFPVDMCFTDTYWGYTAMTYDEFAAAGGVYEIPAFDPGLTQD